MLKKIFIALVAIFLIIQVFRPAKNLSVDRTYDISNKYVMSPDVAKTLNDACYNCHSNKTDYPWYANVQPVAWWLAHHVNKGKRALNFSEFMKRRVASQNNKFGDMIKLVKEDKMPLHMVRITP